MQPPISIRELQKFIGRVVALSRFISRLAEKSLPFFEILRVLRVFRWMSDHQQAFVELKQCLVELTTLKPPPPKAPLILYVAAAPKAVSDVLVYQDPDEVGVKQWPVYYVSETLTRAHCNYIVVDKLLYGVLMASRKLRRYFDDHSICIPSKYPLRDNIARDKAPSRVLKWATEPGQYDIKFVARKALQAGVLADFVAEWTQMEKRRCKSKTLRRTRSGRFTQMVLGGLPEPGVR